jgi:TonB family protein
MAVILTASACTGAQEKPSYYDSDTTGKKAKRAEFPNCTPRTETGPILLDGRLPKYPRRELMVGNIGSVDVRFVVEKTGTTTSIEILRATSRRFSTASNSRFEEEVVAAVGEWIFEPAMDQGMPVAVVCSQRHQFDNT